MWKLYEILHISAIGVLITILTKPHEPPSRVQGLQSVGFGGVQLKVGFSGFRLQGLFSVKGLWVYGGSLFCSVLFSCRATALYGSLEMSSSFVWSLGLRILKSISFIEEQNRELNLQDLQA